MTRSVEIPEQAVVAALGGYDEVPAVTAAWVPLDVGCEKIVDAVMAVLAGEQEQVER